MRCPEVLLSIPPCDRRLVLPQNGTNVRGRDLATAQTSPDAGLEAFARELNLAAAEKARFEVHNFGVTIG